MIHCSLKLTSSSAATNFMILLHFALPFHQVACIRHRLQVITFCLGFIVCTKLMMSLMTIERNRGAKGASADSKTIVETFDSYFISVCNLLSFQNLI